MLVIEHIFFIKLNLINCLNLYVHPFAQIFTYILNLKLSSFLIRNLFININLPLIAFMIVLFELSKLSPILLLTFFNPLLTGLNF